VELFVCGYFISWFIGWLVDYLFDWLISRSVSLSISLSVSRSVDLFVDRPISLLVGQFFCQSVGQSISLSVGLSVGQSFCRSVGLTVRRFCRSFYHLVDVTRLADMSISYRYGDASTYYLMNVDIYTSLLRQCCIRNFSVNLKEIINIDVILTIKNHRFKGSHKFVLGIAPLNLNAD
jgi:hypothetical protein